MFGNEDQFRAIMHQLLHEIVTTTLQMCAQLNSANQLAEKTDVLEGFFAMMAQLYKKIPQVVFASGLDTAALFQCGKIVFGFLGFVVTLGCFSRFVFVSAGSADAEVVRQFFSEFHIAESRYGSS